MNTETEIPALKEFLDQFDSPDTTRAYRKDVNLFFEFTKKQCWEINKLDLISYVDKLKKEKKSSSSIARMFSAIKSYFSFMVSIDMLAVNPADKKIKLPKVQNRHEEGITDEELKKFFAVVKNTTLGLRNRAIVNLMLYNGLRRAEVCNLRAGDIRRTEAGLVVEIRGKGGKTRIRPLHNECYIYITAYLKTCRRTRPPVNEFLFLNKMGNPISGENIFQMTKSYSKKAGLKRNLHPHLFRAKFASMAIEAGAKLTSVQEDMGHSSVTTTGRYDKARTMYLRSGVHNINPLGQKKRKK